MKAAERGVLVGVVVAIALVLRWGYVAGGEVVSPLRADAGQYAQCAHNLVTHGVYSLSTDVPPPPDSVRSPGYPLFLAACRWLAGGAWQELAVALQVALSTLVVLAVYRLARRICGFWPSLLAAALTAFSPHLVTAPAFILTECITTVLVAVGLWLLAGAVCTGTRVRSLGAALTLGAVPLCNETLVFVPLLAGTWFWRQSGLRPAAPYALLMLAPLAIWLARNQITPLAHTGSERLVASISHGSYPGMVFNSTKLRGYAYLEDPEQPAFGASWSRLREVLTRRVAAEPWRYMIWYLFEKPAWLWGWKFTQGIDVTVYEVTRSPYDMHDGMAATHRLMRWLHTPIMLLAAAGVLAGALLRRRDPLLALLAWFVVLGTLAYVPVVPDPRYLQAVRPLLFVLAAAVVANVVVWAQRRLAASAAQPIAAGPVET